MPAGGWNSLALGLSYLAICHNPVSGWRSLWKTAPVASLALAVAQAGGPWMLSLALGVGAVGDLALSRPGQRAFLAGMVAFGLAHMLYVMLFAATLLETSAEPAPLRIGMTLALLTFVLSTEWWLIPFAGALRAAVRAYVAILGIMGVLAIWLPVDLWLVQLGAALFILSDFILSLESFRLPPGPKLRRIASRAVWASYFAAQCALAYGLSLAS